MKQKVLFFVLMVISVAAMSQAYNQSQQCPGWNNPTSFTQGNTYNYYSAAIGSASGHQAPNVLTGDMGFRPLTDGVYVWPTILTAAQIATQGTESCTPTSGSNYGLPEGGRPFRIMNLTDQQGTHPVNMDPNSQDHLPFVPTQFNTTNQDINTNLVRSVRIGDYCSVSGQSANALYYHIRPTSQNSLLYIYYALVVEKPTHGANGNPAFIIRVTRKNSNNQYVQISDTLAYAIVSGTEDCPIQYNFNTNGWHQVYGSSNIQYKDWVKVALNLNDYLYENLRIEFMINDCDVQFHYAYAYVAGECRPLELLCTYDDTSASITAPRGMLSYEWKASRFGASYPIGEIYPGSTNSHFSFRTLASGTENQGMYVYNTQPHDFHVFYRTATPGGHDSIEVDSTALVQTFECKMTTALDPEKPYTSSLYINVPKPSTFVDTIWRTVTATVNDSSLGRVFGGGRYPDSSIATITAIPYINKVYLGWSDGDTVNPRQVLVTQDTTLTALFSTPDTIYIHDTTTIYDTIINTVHDTINNFIYDTTLITDTLWLTQYDTVWVYDTIYIYDTVYVPTEGIDGVDAIAAKIYSSYGHIVVESGDGGILPDVKLYDALGRCIETHVAGRTSACHFTVPTSGVYMVKIGNHPSRKVVVIK